MKNKKGFFDADETTEQISEKMEIPCSSKEGDRTDARVPKSEKKISGKSDKRKLIIICAVCALAFLLGAHFILDTVNDSIYDGGNDQGGAQGTKLYLYPPDWDTDIYTVEEYMELKRDIVYSPDGLQFITLDPGSYYEYGGYGLIFMTNYIQTIIAGDHERLNAMFADEYWDTRDHENKKPQKYQAFPKQKLFNVKIVKYQYNDPKYDNTNVDDHYYIVSYSIYRNDGMFRNDIDEYSELAQCLTVLIDDEGNGIITSVIDLPGYIAGHMN